MPAWYLIRTKTNSEQVAASELRGQDYETYFPRFQRRVRRFGRRRYLVGPLFPGYIFVGLRLGVQTLTAVKSTKGVLNVVRFGEEYAVVAPSIIEQLRRHADQTTGLHALSDRLQPNMRIRVRQGPFEGVEGIFLRECGADRVLVLMNILGHDRTIQLCEDILEPA